MTSPTFLAVASHAPSRIAAALVFFLAIFPAIGRQLPAIDRLGDAPARIADPAQLANVRSRAMDTSVDSRLGIPRFMWAQGKTYGVNTAPGASAAAAPSMRGMDHASAARAHLRNLSTVFALPPENVDPLPLTYQHNLPNGGAVVKFRNRIGGVEVFREEASLLLDPDRALVAVGGFISGGQAETAFAFSAAEAIGVALQDWNFDVAVASQLSTTETRDDYVYFALPGGMASADGSSLKSEVRAKKVLFRLPDRLRPAYYIEVEMTDGAQPGEIDRYAYVVDAGDKSVLFRHDQTAADVFSYRVFAEATGTSTINLPLPSPSGRNGYPHPNAVPNGYQGPFVSSNLVALQNLPFSRNDPWLPPGATVTTGNNVDAFADLVSPDGFSGGDVRATTTSAKTFDRAFDPAQTPGSSNTQIQAAVTNLFYMNNWLHDWYYDSGFDEVSGNAQTNNFGRGGVGNDSIFAEAQDFNGRNNANMSTPADGSRPRMRMYVFDGSLYLQANVNSPAGIAGIKTSAGDAYGPKSFNVTGNVLYLAPFDGCTAFPFAAFAGSIALIDRGNCFFKTKTLNAQTAGAIGVIIVNNASGVQTLGDDPSNPASITIPSVMFDPVDGAAIKGVLPGVNVTLSATASIDRDGTVDNSIIAHEWGHYISNRLVVNSNGLTTNQSGGMGEGFGDFHALLLLVKGADSALPNNANFSGTYAEGAYALGGSPDPASTAYYYGFRRYPYSRDMTKNPLTFRHITNGVALPVSPPPAFGADGSSNSEVHNTGEVWASMLWECYSNLLNDTGRLTFTQAQDRMKRYMVGGYKMMPAMPTFTEARDAILSVIAAQDGADYALCAEGFAKRGAGPQAVAPDRFSTTNAGVIESFAAGGALAIVSTTITDTLCDADGILDNGETGTLSITIRNTGTTPLVATSGTVSSSNTHISFPAGNGFTVPSTIPLQNVTVTVPIQLSGASGVETSGLTVSVDDPALSITRPVVASASTYVNADELAVSTSDSVETSKTAWTIGNTPSSAAAGLQWQRIAISGTDHRWSGPDAGSAQLTWLQSPPLDVAASGNFSFTFRHRFSFEFDSLGNYDGGQIQISTNNGANWTSIGASASPAYNGTIFPGGGNPLGNQPGYVQSSAGYPAFVNVTVSLGTAYQGQTVRVRFAIGSDTSGAAPGWEIDDIAFSNITNTPFYALAPQTVACFSVTPTAGTPQGTLLNTAFPTALKALVKNGAGTPVPSFPVTFAAPASGPSGSFASGTTVLTDGTGVATAPALTANGSPGAYTATATAGVQSASYALKNTLVASGAGLDVDANLAYDPATDGLLVMRYLFGNTGPALTANAIGASPNRTDPGDIVTYLNGLRPLLDIDANGKEDPLTDGVLLVRYMFGLRGSALVSGALAPDATRTQAADIEHYIQGLLP